MNTKSKKYKEYLKVYGELRDVWEKQRNLGYAELDEPIHIGYTAKLSLRADVSRRKDADVFQFIIDNFASSSDTRHPNLYCRIKKNKLYKHYVSTPHIQDIEERTYDSLPPSVQKWFSDNLFGSMGWGRVFKSYCCYVPSYFFEIVFEERYKTHYKIHDEVLCQIESEIYDKLCWDYYKYFRVNNYGPIKEYATIHNKKDRRHNKVALKKYIDYMVEDDHCGNGDWQADRKSRLRYQHRNSAKWEVD